MKILIERVFPRKSLLAILGLYTATAGCAFALIHWASSWSNILGVSETEIEFKGLAIIIGTTLVRHILIANGRDIAANWVDRKK